MNFSVISIKKTQTSLLTFLCACNFVYCAEKTAVPQKEYYAVPPPQYPSEEEGMSIFLDGSYTFWAPYQNGMFLLTTNSTTEKKASWIKTAFPVQSGFKAGLGFNTFHDGWKLQAEYTWFYNHPSIQPATLQVPNVDYYCPWINQDTLAGSVSSKFCNTFQRVDLTMDRTYYLGNYLAVGPWIGILGAWDDQDFYVKIGPIADANPPADADIRIMTQNMSWWCIGPYIGVDSSYYFYDEWAIFCTGGASLNLALHYTNSLVTDASENNTVIYSNTGAKIPSIEPMFETSLGLRWDSAGQDWGLRVQIGWELQAYLDHCTFFQTMDNTFSSLPSYGTYGMQGLTVKIRLNF